MNSIINRIRSDKSIYSFTTDAMSGKLGHAYLISATDNSTVNATLHYLAQVILCEHKSACGSCGSCMRISKDIHPDVKWYDSKDKIIKVEVIEELLADSTITALESPSKILIIPNADRLNPTAQNKLLKTLEEPPKDVFIMLGAINDIALLPTIKSRLKKIFVNIWNAASIRQELAADGHSIDKIEFALSMSSCSLEKARDIISNDKLYDRYNIIINMLTSLKSSKDIVSKVGFLGASSEAAVSLSLLERIFGKLVEDHIRGNDNPLMSIYNKAVAVATVYNINDLMQKLESNCVVAALENNFIFTLLENKYKLKAL